MNKDKLFLLFTIVIILFQSCKKGNDDPVLSLRSRKARLVGEWNLVSGKLTNSNLSGSLTTTYNGTEAISTGYNKQYTEKWIIKKDMSFEMVINDNGIDVNISGSWHFGYKSEDMKLKNKEWVIFRVTSYKYKEYGDQYTETFIGTSCPTITYIITGLWNKELIVYVNGSDTWPSNYDSTMGSLSFNQK